MSKFIVLTVIVAYIGFWVLCGYGYFSNIYKLTQCNFKEPYKCEVIRGIGVAAPPVGIIAGYIDLED